MEKDVNDLSILLETYWINMPEDVAKPVKQTCSVLKKCCSGKTYNNALLSMAGNFTDNPYAAAQATCLETIDSDESNEICSATVESDALTVEQTKEEMEISQIYLNVRMSHSQQMKQSANHLGNVCNAKEIHAYLCMLNNKHLKSCVKKLIQQQFEMNGADGSKQYVKQYKKQMGNINQKVQQLKAISD